MNRLLAGYEQHRRTGLSIPASVREETDKAAQEANQVLRFVTEACRRSPELKIRAGELHRHYHFWCERQGAKPMSMAAFKGALEKTFDVEQQRTNRGGFWIGFALDPSPSTF